MCLSILSLWLATDFFSECDYKHCLTSIGLRCRGCAGTLPKRGGSPTFSTTHLARLSGRDRGLGGVKSPFCFVRVGCGLHTSSIPSLPFWCSQHLLSLAGAGECCQPQPAVWERRLSCCGSGALDCDSISSFKPVLTEFEKYLIVHPF